MFWIDGQARHIFRSSIPSGNQSHEGQRLDIDFKELGVTPTALAVDYTTGFVRNLRYFIDGSQVIECTKYRNKFKETMEITISNNYFRNLFITTITDSENTLVSSSRKKRISEPSAEANSGSVYVTLSDGRYLKKIIGGKNLAPLKSKQKRITSNYFLLKS